MDKSKTKPVRSLECGTPAASTSGKSLGVQKFYTKLRHKIEDNLTPKFTRKLAKTNKHSVSMTSLRSVESCTEKYTPFKKSATIMLKRPPQFTESTSSLAGNRSPNATDVLPANCGTISPLAAGAYVDSDDDCQLSLNLTKQSLEDEIFEALEKVAHDETKLNAVLKSFDKILSDYQETSGDETEAADIAKTAGQPTQVAQAAAAGGPANRELPSTPTKLAPVHEQPSTIFTKSKTCSNINTTGVQKNVASSQQPKLSATAPKKLEKSQSYLSMSQRNLYQSPDSPCLLNMRRAYSNRACSKSVWELTAPNYNSRIPVFKALMLQKRSNSFCNAATAHMPLKELPENKRKSFDGSGWRKLSLHTAPAPVSAMTTPAKQRPKKKSSTSMSTSIPYELNRIQVMPGAAADKLPAKLNVRGNAERTKVAAATPSTKKHCSQLNVNLRKTTATVKQPPKSSRDEQLLDKCLEKGQEILRKVETLNAEGGRKPRSTITAAATKTTKKTSSLSQRSDSASKSKDRDITKSKQQMPPLHYADEEKCEQPPLESCKIIPPVLGATSDKHVELLVNVVPMLSMPTKNLSNKQHQQDLIHACMGVGQDINQPPLNPAADPSPDVTEHIKDSLKYADFKCTHDDADSDDSGHISNENETATTTMLSGSTASTGSYCESDACDSLPVNCSEAPTVAGSGGKSSKISALCQKFEQQSNNAHKNTTNHSSAHGHTSSHANTTAGAHTNANARVCSAVKVAEIEAVQCIQSKVEIYPTYSKEILFRSGVLSELEAKRDELLSDRIIQLQAVCRGFLARKQVAQRRVQELAVRCIQRNVKAFLVVRDWPWWRLLVRVAPLLNVHRTEEQLKTANEELLMLRAKLEKIESDRNELKTENQKLEAKLSEMAVDLAEERSASNIATERLEAETAERLKLEKEVSESQNKVKKLQESTEKLEMELICAKSDLNGISEDEDPDNEEGGGNGVYKLKYERVARELEFTKRRLQTQHEHDLEQLVGLKKQLEKKLSDAYEEVEEQRQVVGQWKRKAQKMTNEMNDVRMLLEEQNARNNLLEKKQRKFDSECQSLQDVARQERQAKERLSREKDVHIAEKFTLEQSLADTRLELELKEEKLASLQRELEEMTFGGGTEEEVAHLRRSKNDLDRRVKEQEEELDEMAGQVQLLEQAKLRLEMSLETMRKDARREAQQRDEELEEARGSAYKKIKALECQLETEHEERTLLLREKHELERRLSSVEDQDRMDRQAEEATNQKLRRDLRKYKALLKDAHAQLERLKTETPGKTLIRQLRNQLEDAESARSLAMKARQTAEAELAEVQTMFDESHRARNDAEDRANAAHRDRAELQAQIEENEEELAELMKKYSAAVKQLNTEQIAASEYEFKLSELEAERNNLKEQVSELQQRLENVENMADPSAAMMSKRLELRTKELESRLELEQATRARLEVQVTRHKEALEKIQSEVTQSKIREMQGQDALKKSQKALREMREEFHVVSGREQESITKRKDLEKKLEQVESEATALKNDLRLALQRIADLQQAMEEGDDDVSESEESQSSDGSLSDLEGRLRHMPVKRNPTAARNGLPSSTTTLVREKDDNSPRITLTSPSSPHIHKLAAAAKAKADAAAASAAAAETVTKAGSTAKAANSISGGDSLKNGEASFA